MLDIPGQGSQVIARCNAFKTASVKTVEDHRMVNG